VRFVSCCPPAYATGLNVKTAGGAIIFAVEVDLFTLQAAAVSHCGPLQRACRSAASPRRAAASGQPSRWPDCWRRLPSLSAAGSVLIPTDLS
jgi:hypothetical protein